MKRFGFGMSAGTALFVFGLSWIVFGSGSPTGEQVLAEIQHRYQTTNDLEATFIQEYVGKVMKSVQRSEGKVYFKKKGMMRWDYKSPNQKLISNGQTLWFFQPDDNQVFVSEVSKVVGERTPLAFLAGEGDLRREFDLTGFNESLSAAEGHWVLELIPKESTATLAKLVLTVDKRNFYVQQADVVDGLGNVTRTRFLNIKTNLSLPDSLFHFTVPPGVEVLRMQEPSSAGKGAPK